MVKPRKSKPHAPSPPVKYRVTAAKKIPGTEDEYLGVSHSFRSAEVATDYRKGATARGFAVIVEQVVPDEPMDPTHREHLFQLAAVGVAATAAVVAHKIPGLSSVGPSLNLLPLTRPSGGPSGGTSTPIAVNTSDPISAPFGAIWYRTDLGLLRFNSGLLGILTLAPADPTTGGLMGLPISSSLTSTTLVYAGLGKTPAIGFDSSSRLILDPTNVLGVVTPHNVLDDTSGNASFAGTITASSYYGELDTATLDGYGFSLALTSGYLLGWNGSHWVMYPPGSGAVASLNSLVGAITIAAGTAISVSSGGTTITINNTGVTSAVAGNGVSVSSATGAVTFSAVLNGTTLSLGSSGLSLNLGNANTWTAVQTFGNNISIGGFQFNVTAGATGDILYNSGTRWINLAVGSTGYVLAVSGGIPAWTSLSTLGVSSLQGLTGALSLTSPLSTLSIGTSGSNVTIDLAQVDLSDSLITSTSETNIATYTPSAQRNVFLHIYFRVVTAPTTVLIQITYTDGSGPETYTPVNQTCAVGSYIVAPMNVNATAATLTITVTIGNANYVYMSANIRP
jgi:hypothetical protein